MSLTRTRTGLEHDPAALDEALERLEASDWNRAQLGAEVFDASVAHLREAGLERFRGTRDLGLWMLDMVEFPPTLAARQALLRKHGPARIEELTALLDLVEAEPELAALPFGLSLTDLHDLAELGARQTGELAGAVELERIEGSLLGGPAAWFESRGQPLTHGLLGHYRRYALAAGKLDFEQVDTVLLLGPGFGQVVEILTQAHPHLSFVLAGGSLESYVSGQYLSAALGRSVQWLDAGHLPDPGGIGLLDPEGLEALPTDRSILAWNEHDLGCMPRAHATDVLETLARTARFCFLRQAGDFPWGVLEAAGFEELAREPARNPLRRVGHDLGVVDSVWRKP